MSSLIVIENGFLTTFNLEEKHKWKVGRPSKNNIPDIKMYSLMISRQQGEIKKVDGSWFYTDKYKKNTTFYNSKKLEKGDGITSKSVLLNDGDILVFGCGLEETVDFKTVWAMYMEKELDDRWRIEETSDVNKLCISSNNEVSILKKPKKGTVFKTDSGIAIYMGNITYLNGDISIMGYN